VVERLETYGLNGSIDPPRVTTAYRAGLLIVAVAMLVLPLLYLGLIAAAARLLWWHVTSNTWILESRSGGIWKIAGYFGPAIAGLVVVFFMIKPVLARPARATDPVPLAPGDQPALFEFIRAICRQVGAPFPTRIQVDCQVNASAGFARVPWTLGRPDLVLTIGLPLAAGLSVRQFAGVLAHEFGHFAQTGGMRLTFIVRSINHWLARVAHERDQWDESLEEWAGSGTAVVLITFQLAKAAVWISRTILSLLMRAGHVISSFMLRQMEYDADSYEVSLVGTGTFIATSTRMRELNVGAQVGYADLQNAWARRSLPADLPAYLVGHSSRLPDALLAQIRAMPSATTSLFDTHPSDADRARAAEALEGGGIFTGGDQQASVLFRDFDAVAAATTRHHYVYDLGLDLDAATLMDSAAAMQATRERERAQKSVAAVFGGTLSLQRPFQVPWPPPAMTLEAATSGLAEARDLMARDREPATALVQRFDDLVHARYLAELARQVLQAGFTQIVPDDFRLTSPTGEDADAADRAAQAALLDIESAVQRYEGLARGRSACVLALLGLRQAIPPSQRTALVYESNRVVPALNALAAVWPAIADLHHLLLMSEVIEGNAPKSPDQAAATRAMSRLAARQHELLRRIRTGLGDAASPDGGPPATLAETLGFSGKRNELPNSITVVGAAAAVRFDLIGRLASVILSVEEEGLRAAGSGLQEEHGTISVTSLKPEA
jgi:Zn-dependent protease with chaperone function